MDQLPDINWGGPGYPAYDGEMKVSPAETAAQQQTALNAQWLSDMMRRQFSESQNLLNGTLLPQLTQMVTNPQGFGAKEVAAVRSQTIGTIGTQLASQQRGLQQQFATQNMAGLGSGVQAALSANLAQTAAGQEAAGLQDIAIQNAQMQQQQRQFGLQGLAGASQLLGQMPQSGALANQATGQQFQQAQQMATQGGFFTNLITGMLSSAAGGLTGGMTGGLGFLGNLFKGQQPLQVASGGVSAPSPIGMGAMADPNIGNILAYPTSMPTQA